MTKKKADAQMEALRSDRSVPAEGMPWDENFKPFVNGWSRKSGESVEAARARGEVAFWRRFEERVEASTFRTEEERERMVRGARERVVEAEAKMAEVE